MTAICVLKRRLGAVLALGGMFLWGCGEAQGAAEGVAPPATYSPDSWQGWSKATIRVLDRLESRSQILTLSVGEEGHYRSLSVKMQACVQRPPTVAPEAAVQLHIEDSKARIPAPFEGWILVNQPSLSLYQSPLYDVQLVGCNGEKTAPMMGPLPAVSAPQISAAEPERQDADGQAGLPQGMLPGGAPTSLLPQESGMADSQSANPGTGHSGGPQPSVTPPSLSGGPLPPPTSLLP